MAQMPIVWPEKCNGCGLCVGVCPNNALVLKGNIITVVETDTCDWCTVCEAVCPTRAIACPYEIVAEGE